MITHIRYVHFHVVTKSTLQSLSSVVHSTGFKSHFQSSFSLKTAFLLNYMYLWQQMKLVTHVFHHILFYAAAFLPHYVHLRFYASSKFFMEPTVSTIEIN